MISRQLITIVYVYTLVHAKGRLCTCIYCGAMLPGKFVNKDQYLMKNEKSLIFFTFGAVLSLNAKVYTCSTSPPSGNLVDGLPLVAHNDS